MSDIIVRRDQNILRITINRVAKRNALTAEMYLTMSDALDEAGEDETYQSRADRSGRPSLQRR